MAIDNCLSREKIELRNGKENKNFKIYKIKEKIFYASLSKINF